MLAATLAALAHEAIGHGVGCFVVGGRVTLLTSIFFRCAGATALTDAAGPFGSLAFGLIGLSALKNSPPSSWVKFFLLACSTIGLGWFAGQAIYCAILNTDDWAGVARSLHWPPVWRLEAVAGAAGVYVWAAGVLASYSGMRNMIVALLAAAASAAVAGVFWTKAPLSGAAEGAAAVGLAPAVLLLMVTRRATAADEAMVPSSRAFWAWCSVSALTYTSFLVYVARGIGSLS